LRSSEPASRFYRYLPVTARYDETANPQTGHLFSPDTGHIIELARDETDEQGRVPSSFGAPGAAFVQEKIEQLLQFAHEYAHVMFDEVVSKAANHSLLSSYAAMTWRAR